METKLCKGDCGLIKPVSDFTVAKRNGDKILYKTRCKPCIGLYYRQGGLQVAQAKAVEEASKIPKGHLKCSRKECGKIKPLTDFKKQSGNRLPVCKECINIDERERENYPRRVQEIMDVYDAIPIITTKLCNKCDIEKDLSEFRRNFRNTGSLKIHNQCSECETKIDREYYLANRETIINRVNTYVANNREQVKEYHRLYYLGIRTERKKPTDEEFRLMKSIKKRISDIFNNINFKKDMRTNEIIGCSYAYFALWMEFQFDSNMSWSNYGTYWHVDHVTPCSSFNLLDREEQLICFNWSNCRPLEAKENMSKGDTIIPLQIHLQQLRAEAYIKLLSATHPN